MKRKVERSPVRFAPVLATAKFALFAASLALAGQAQAAAQPGLYVAALVTPVPAPRQEIVDGQLWKCSGEECTAPAQGGRAAGTCARVARKLGPLARFTSPQGELSAEELARCNGSH
jgi:hypothetical protein